MSGWGLHSLPLHLENEESISYQRFHSLAQWIEHWSCTGAAQVQFKAWALKHPYGKAVFVRISDEYAANIQQTALFAVIVRYIFTSCREYPANRVGLTKK